MVTLDTFGFTGSTALAAEDGMVSTKRPHGNWASRALDCAATFLEEVRGGSKGSFTRAQLIFIQTRDELSVFFAKKPGKYDRIGTLPAMYDARATAALAQKLGRVPGEEIVLRIASDRAIRKVISLPSSALSFLPSIVRNKVESLSPWQSADMLWGYRLVGGSADGQIAVEIGMTGKASVTILISSLKASGINVNHIEFGDSIDAEDRINVLSTTDTSQGQSRKLLLSAVALGTFSLLAGLTAAVQAWNAQGELAFLTAQQAKFQAKLDESSAANSQMTEVSTAWALAARKHQSVPLIVLLKELTLSIPNETWLQSIVLSEGHVTITGKGGAVSAIIAKLEKSPLLQNVNFAAATQRNTSDKQDAFSISADVSPVSGEK